MRNWLCKGKFDDGMLEDFMKFYNELVKDKEDEAIIYIDSGGGFVHTAVSMISIMTGSKVKFHTCVLGRAESAALVLLAHGEKRFAVPGSRLMFYDLSFVSVGKVDEVEEQVKESKEVSKSFIKMFADKTKKPITWWIKKSKEKETRDFYFSPAKAKEYGIIDKIGLPDIITVSSVF